MKKYTFILTVVVIIICAAAFIPSKEISHVSYNAAGMEVETVITWNFTGHVSNIDEVGVITVERFFSIERYIDGDINDCFYIGIHNKHYEQPSTKEILDWHKIVIEAWKNTDEAWLNLEIGF